MNGMVVWVIEVASGIPDGAVADGCLATCARAEDGRASDASWRRARCGENEVGGGDFGRRQQSKSRRVFAGLLSIDGLSVSGRGDDCECFADGPV